ncbi:DUF5694 domain-containing protein [Hymenobacter sp. H14-R3]|uniref:DUF5694 domain-containing protein n=1 Tax=Hymenobacter sp. H14-R3 TaxID=3046308 RepID=UPI0024BA049F|nr:DUF5694 domain-containing protein [Hymenobacter sp. H14-R3]MDJ0366316.1 DUF5694 domain-containing protein [Hymenobacter sp. H14-R3]
MKHLFLLVLLLALASQSFAQTKQSDLLLLGTFHFHNPGADIAKTKTFEVMTPKPQAELEVIAQKISAFQPAKIFVEWPVKDQAGLDELYSAYLKDGYEQYIRTKYPKPSQQGFYLKNEIVQLAFRAGKKAKLTRIYGLDYSTSFPFDSVMKAMKAAKQDALIQQLQDVIKNEEATQNKKAETYSLTEMLLDANKPKNLVINKGFYLNILNRAGSLDSFAGPFLVSEWYRRNLYMYSIVQKTMTAEDGNAVVLVGAGHAAMMQDFVKYDKRFRLKTLKEVLEK